MSSFCFSTNETHSPKQAILFSRSKRMKNESFFDTMGHQRLSEYQSGLPLFKVNEPPKFQMSFCISTGETNTQYGLLYTVFHLPADSNRERAMNCGRSSTGTRHRCSVCLKFGM